MAVVASEFADPLHVGTVLRSTSSLTLVSNSLEEAERGVLQNKTQRAADERD